MVVMINDSKLNRINKIKSFLSETEALEFNRKSKKRAIAGLRRPYSQNSLVK